MVNLNEGAVVDGQTPLKLNGVLHSVQFCSGPYRVHTVGLIDS